MSLPKPREIFAAHFRDRIVHHLLISRLTPLWERKFIHASFACRKDKGTHGALRHFQQQVRSLSQGGTRHVWALQLDIASFFVTIHRPTLCEILKKSAPTTEIAKLIEILYLHDARLWVRKRGPEELFALIPKEKSWFSQGAAQGLPIGNLTSQFGANVYLTELDHFILRTLKPKAYLRYMDDLLLLSTDPEELRPLADIIDQWLMKHRSQRLNPSKTCLKRLDDGIRYLGFECRQTTIPSEPLQFFTEPKKKWNWVKELRGWEKTQFGKIPKPHPLGLAPVTNDEVERKIARVNSRLGHMGHSRSYLLRKKSLDKLIELTTEDHGLPEEVGHPWPRLKIKKGYTSIKRR